MGEVESSGVGASAGPRAASAPPVFGWGLSGHRDPSMAAAQVAERAGEMLRTAPSGDGGGGSSCDLVFLFMAGEHAAAAPLIAREVRERLGATAIVGVSTQAVIGGAVELEGAAGVAVL